MTNRVIVMHVLTDADVDANRVENQNVYRLNEQNAAMQSHRRIKLTHMTTPHLARPTVMGHGLHGLLGLPYITIGVW